MWSLLDLLPHLTRLVPMAERYFQNRGATDKAHEEAFAAMTTGLRADLTTANSSLSHQLQNQQLQLTQLTDDVKRTRITVESAQQRADATEIQLATLTRLFKIAAIGITLLLAVLILLLAQLLHTR